MKKTLVAAITSALVIGAASTTFAAANSFSDVPTDHWSFDAVAKLSREGVIEGYGDNTFKGDAHITRYEMAQMVAKAMAKEEAVDAATKATIDKLAAEYADELNNLGVRVANLEKKTDNVKFVGMLRIDGTQSKVDKRADGDDKKNSLTGKVRLDMTAAVNSDWVVKARLDGDADLANDTTDKKFTLAQAWAEGPLVGATAKIGKFNTFQGDNLTGGGMIMDTEVNGAEFAWKSKDIKTTLTYGRLPDANYAANGYSLIPGLKKDDHSQNQISQYVTGGKNSDYMALQVAFNPNDKWAFGLGYFNVHKGDGFTTEAHFYENSAQNSLSGLKNNNQIWSVGAKYNFTKNLRFGAIYAQSNVDALKMYDHEYNESKSLNSAEKKAYSFELNYGGTNPQVKGSYAAWIAYRQLGSLATIAPTYDGAGYGQKGVEIGVDYMVAKNILTKLVYFDGKRITAGSNDTDKVQKLFGRIDFMF